MPIENVYSHQNDFNIISSEFAAIKKWGYGAIHTQQNTSDWIKIKESNSATAINIKGLKKILKDDIKTKRLNTRTVEGNILLHS